MGIDLALLHTGLALPDGNLHTLTIGSTLKGYRRHQAMVSAVRTFIANAQPNLIVLEAYNIGAGKRTPIALIRAAEVGGILRTSIALTGIPRGEVPPSTLKKYATNNGAAKKDAMIESAVLDAFATNQQSPHDDHQADAYWLRHIGLAAIAHPSYARVGFDEHRPVITKELIAELIARRHHT